MKKHQFAALWIIILFLGLIGCNSQGETSTPIETIIPSNTPTPLPTSTFTQLQTPTQTPVPTNIKRDEETTSSETSKDTAIDDPICNVKESEKITGWDCLSESYGFVIHFSDRSEIIRSEKELVDIRLVGVEDDTSIDARIDRILEIFVGERAESCFSSYAEKVQVGEYEFLVKNGEEFSGAIFAWKSYGIKQGLQNVCFFYVAGYQTFPDNSTELIPPEEDQRIDYVEAVLETFKWIDP